jgi:prepilin-type N-terminal cleavage/methylation domain-containing protein
MYHLRMKYAISRRAFSLVELSIVLVILGLLVGGVLSGQSLIRAAELRSVASDYSRYITATQTFRDKYFALPGDMTNATQFWGIQSPSTTGNDTTCYDTLSTSGTATCSGNGDGNFCNTFSQCYEGHRYWQHLANAGLIEGRFTGTGTNATSRNVGVNPGVNGPISKLSKSTFQMMNLTRGTGTTDFAFDSPSTQMGYYFGAVTCTTGCGPNNPNMKGEEAWNIDTKLDDGRPAFGKIQTYKFGNTGVPAIANCATTNVSSTAEYNLSDPAMNCGLMMAF